MSHRFAFPLLSALVIPLGLAVACSSDSDPANSGTGGSGGSPGAAGSGGSAGSTGDAGTDAQESKLPQGEFQVGVALAPLGGLVLEFQINVKETEVELRAVDGTKLSDVLATADVMNPGADGKFDLAFGQFTLPGEFTPTGSNVDADLTINGQLKDNLPCGEISGEIVTLSLDVKGSTFGSAPWTDRLDPPPTSCEGSARPIDRIETCPTLTDGTNTGFPSGKEPRSFEVVLPSTYDSSKTYPLLFVFHGYGGNGISMLDGAGYRPYADSEDWILIAPDGLDDAEGGNGRRWDTFNQAATNADVAFFDDMVKCADESFGVDMDRIYASGMSFGGLMTGTLIATRADVLAAAAPFSGGFTAKYQTPTHKVPVIASYGGPSDKAFDQEFEKLATTMTMTLTDNGHFAVLCNHNEGHSIKPTYLPWAMKFLKDHPKGVSPEPYSDPLPMEFPSYCTIQ